MKLGVYFEAGDQQFMLTPEDEAEKVLLDKLFTVGRLFEVGRANIFSRRMGGFYSQVDNPTSVVLFPRREKPAAPNNEQGVPTTDTRYCQHGDGKL